MLVFPVFQPVCSVPVAEGDHCGGDEYHAENGDHGSVLE